MTGIESAAQGISPPESDPPPLVPLDVAALQAILDGDRVAIRSACAQCSPIRAIAHMGYHPTHCLVLGWLRELADAGFGALAYPGKTTDAPSLRDFTIAFETLAVVRHLSLLVKFGVQFGLFGGSIFFLGTGS